MLTGNILVKVQPKGVITLPKAWREELGIKERGLVEIEKKKDRLVIRPVSIVRYPVRRYQQKEIKQFLQLEEQETAKLKAKGLL